LKQQGLRDDAGDNEAQRLADAIWEALAEQWFARAEEGEEITVPVHVTYDIAEVAEHRAGVIEINRVILNNPPNNAETRKERELFTEGVIWHEVWHLLNSDKSEEEAQKATLEYFKTHPEILEATIKVLDSGNPNWIYGEDWLYKLEIAGLQRRYEILANPEYGFIPEKIADTRGKFITDVDKPYPAVNPDGYKSFHGITGYPFPATSRMQIKIDELKQYLRRGLDLGADTLYLQPDNDLHSTVFTIQDPRDKALALSPEEEFSELKKIYNVLKDTKEFKIRFNRIIVTPAGEIILAGEPQDEEFFKVRRSLDKKHKDVVHITLGRFIKMPEKSRSEIIDALNRWLQEHGDELGAVTVTKDNWKVVTNETNWFFYNLQLHKNYISIDELGEYTKAVKMINKFLSDSNLSKSDIPNIPMEGEITQDKLRAVLEELKQTVQDNPETVSAVLYLLGQSDTIEDTENTAFADLAALDAVGQLETAEGISLNIVDAHIFSGMDKKKAGKLLDIMNGEKAKTAVVVFNEEDKWIVKLAKDKGIAVVNIWEVKNRDAVPEEVARLKAIMEYKISNINSINVLSSLKYANRWRPAVNGMIRYVVCGKDVTIAGILKLYNKLPEDIKKALAEQGLTVKKIERSELVDTNGRFDIDKIKEDAIVETAA